MIFMLQPENSCLCGQTCVAMIAEISLEESISVFGKRSSTTTKDVINALRKLGISCGDRLLSAKKHEKPDVCICVLHYKDFKQTHWCVWNGEWYLDPAYGIIDEYGEGFRVTSYLPIYLGGRK